MKKIRLGIIGMGRWAREAHLRNLRQLNNLFQVHAISSRTEKNIELAKEIIGKEVRVYRDWRELLEDRDIEAVIVTTPNHTHEEIASFALKKGKHVLVEKPPALTVEGCDRLIELSRKVGKVLQVGFEFRYAELFQRAKRLLEEGWVGSPQFIWCREFRGPFLSSWRLQREISGGTLIEKNTHHFDLFNWFSSSRPLWVCGMGGVNVRKEGEVLDHAIVSVEYENGVKAVLLLSLFSPYGDELEVGVIGDRGKFVCYGETQRIIYYASDKPDRVEFTLTPPPGIVEHEHPGTLKELEGFFQAIREGKKPLSDGEAGKWSVAVALAGEKSIQERRFINLGGAR